MKRFCMRVRYRYAHTHVEDTMFKPMAGKIEETVRTLLPIPRPDEYISEDLNDLIIPSFLPFRYENVLVHPKPIEHETRLNQQ